VEEDKQKKNKTKKDWARARDAQCSQFANHQSLGMIFSLFLSLLSVLSVSSAHFYISSISLLYLISISLFLSPFSSSP